MAVKYVCATMSIYDNVLSGYALNGIRLSKTQKDETVLIVTHNMGQAKRISSKITLILQERWGRSLYESWRLKAQVYKIAVVV